MQLIVLILLKEPQLVVLNGQHQYWNLLYCKFGLVWFGVSLKHGSNVEIF